MAANPKENWAYLLEHADALARIQRFQEAIALCDQFLAANGGNADSEQFFIVKAFANEQLGNHQDCIDNCKKALLINPKDGEAYYWMAAAHLKLAPSDEARVASGRREQLKPADAHAFVNRLNSLVMFKNASRASTSQ